MKKVDWLNPFVVFSIILIFFMLSQYWTQQEELLTIPYSEFQTLLESEQIDNLLISNEYIRGDFKSPVENKKKKFVTVRIESDFAKELAKGKIKYSRIVETNFLSNLGSWLLPLLIFFGLWMFISRKLTDQSGLGGGLMSIGKSRAKLYSETLVKTTFADVAGVDEAKEELHEVVEFLKNPSTYSRLGARMPRGILLVGPPGTGKTLMAKAVAGEAKVPFFSIGGSEFVEMFVGVGAARVRDLFEQARKKSPCIIFIDELDSLGKARSPQAFSGGHDEKEQTLNQLLAELDGFDTTSGVIVLAATNRPEILDPALLRAGRFDRQVLIDKPDRRGRTEILRVHIKKIKFNDSVKIEHVAELTPGFTGADLANLVNEAALSATRRNSELVTDEDFTLAIERIVAGLEKKSRLLSAKERKIVAYHEMGHALTAALIRSGDKVHKVSIIPRGIGALGYTIQRPTEDRYIMTYEELIKKISVLLGGRMAEILVFNEASTGAADDLAKVTDIATALVTKYGMSPNVGMVIYNEITDPLSQNPYSHFESRNRSEATATLIEKEIKRIVEDTADKTKTLLKENREILDQGANLLLTKETLNEEDLKRLFELGPVTEQVVKTHYSVASSTD
jgi:cell division protease FtsH